MSHPLVLLMSHFPPRHSPLVVVRVPGGFGCQ